MSAMGPEETTLQDVSAYFSEEEWTLLQDWQKDLYRNVMKEIHLALTSLGPLIATTVCSLRAREKEKWDAVEDQSREKRRRRNVSLSATTSPPDHLLKTDNEEEADPPNNPLKSEAREGKDCLRAGILCPDPGLVLRREEEPVSVFIDPLGAEAEESMSATASEYEVVSLHIKDENEVYDMEHRGSQAMDITSSPTGHESMNRKNNTPECAKLLEKTPSCHASQGRTNESALQSYNKEAHSRSMMWPGYYQDLGGEKAAYCDDSFSNPVHFNVHHGGTKLARSDQYSEFESNLSSSLFPNNVRITQQNRRTYPCNEGDKSYCLKGDFSRPMRTNSRERPHACSECEKSFFQKSHLITHYRTHSSEKPYICTFCPKRFSRKDYLDGHTRIHTGERPYKCSKCEKSFVWKSHLNEHQRKHS
ncbi:zinc finger protein 583-like isoform X2 [Ambystoma mexicanum]|uniref:zinc finger protein 583-like isoform X2 n=1 Tax=Ambystoma mexicanum TaxID=8296 RepID=UPI0037E93EB8